MEPSEDQREVICDRPVPVSSIDLRYLAEIYDEKDIYLSIYLPVGGPEQAMNSTYLNKRTRSIRKAIDEELRNPFERTLAMVEDMLEWAPVQGERGRVIFASDPSGFLHLYRLGVEVERTMVLDTSPFLLPLARLDDDYEDYGILLLDSQEARLYIVRSMLVEERSGPSIDLMNRHKKGGMSQMRFNRLRRGAIGHFIEEVVEDLSEIGDLKGFRGLVIAGPGEAKKMLMEQLPKEYADKIIGTIDISMDAPSGDLIRMGEEVAQKDERRKSNARADELREAVLKGDPAIYGASEVKEALEQGKVSCLILLDSASIPGWICERCQLIKERTAPPPKCPRCGGKPSEVDVVEELYELAQRTGAEVEFVDEHPFLESVGGLGALLRY